MAAAPQPYRPPGGPQKPGPTVAGAPAPPAATPFGIGMPAPPGGGYQPSPSPSSVTSQTADAYNAAMGQVNSTIAGAPFMPPSPPRGADAPAGPTGPAPPGPPNMLTPRAGEQFYADNQQFWTQGPQNIQDWWANNQGAVTGPTNAQGYADKFQDKSSGLSMDLDPYYDRARERAAEDVNRQYGARGMYNSSDALGGLNDAFVDLNAEQANREADFDLARTAEQRAWSGLGGQFASSADESNMAQFLGGMGGAGAVDEMGLGYMEGGADAAFGAQGAERVRLQDFFTNIGMPAAAAADMTQDGLMQLLMQDPALMDSAIAFFTGTAAEGQNQEHRNQEKVKDDTEWWMDMTGKAGSMGGMGGVGA